MNKFILILALGLLTVSGANASQSNYLKGVSVGAGYAGSSMTNKTVDEFKENLNGYFLNATYALGDKADVYIEYEYQKYKSYKFNEIGIGAKYGLFEMNNLYTSIGAGVGYAWMEETLNGFIPADLELKYITLPVHFEMGYKLTSKTSVMGSLGYKWLFNKDSSVCIDSRMGYTCDELDGDAKSATYKIGIRQSF